MLRLWDPNKSRGRGRADVGNLLLCDVCQILSPFAPPPGTDPQGPIGSLQGPAAGRILKRGLGASEALACPGKPRFSPSNRICQIVMQMELSFPGCILGLNPPS